MKKIRFERAINKLQRAFFDGEIEKGCVKTCVMGILCNGDHEWVFFLPDMYEGLDSLKKANESIQETGYKWEGELEKVEKAFGENAFIYYYAYKLYAREEIDSDLFNGLMAVVDVLCDIDNLSDEVREETKKMFVKD